MGGPTSSYAVDGKALELIGAHKPSHPATEGFRQGGETMEGDCRYSVIQIVGILLLQQYTADSPNSQIKYLQTLSK
jgi:hypothetical protein